jgi:UDP-N-acetylmuramate: L-alanyl-gamma-D-glutamyl-meso-diaminopimelate ligase
LSRDWAAEKLSDDGSHFAVYYHGEKQGEVNWSLIGDHNVHNGLMAIAAAHHVGVTCALAIEALASFVNVKRRMEIKGVVNNVTVYDDFAHHPTAITTTVKGLKAKVGVQRILAVLEPRSNTMKQGVHKDALASCWADADEVFLFEPANLGWSMHEVANASTVPVHPYQDVDKLVAAIVAEAQPSDHVLVMSNGGFAGIHGKLLTALEGKFAK